jgi:hypothetical protein
VAEVTVSRAQRDDVLERPVEAPKEGVALSFPLLSRPLVLLWTGLVLGTVAFLALGSLRIGAGNRIGRRMPVREIWSNFLAYLAEQGASAVLINAVVAASAIALIAAGIALWLAFGLRDAYPQPPHDESAGM